MESTTARVMRVAEEMRVTEMAMMTVGRPGPRTTDNSRARIRPGKDISTSTTRWLMRSKRWPR